MWQGSEFEDVLTFGIYLDELASLWQGSEFEDVLTFGIYLDELATMHDGRICRLAGSDPVNPVYALYVDGHLVPEHTSSGLTADIVSIPGHNHRHQQHRGGSVGRRGTTVFGRPFVNRFALCYQTVVCLSCLSVCNVRVLSPNGWTDQDETRHAVRPVS